MDISFIWSFLLSKEGGFSNDPLDPGGKTKYGISEYAFPYINIEHLTKDQAEQIFEDDYFSHIHGNDLLKICPSLALQMSDMAYNCGPVTAVRCLQRALNSINEDVYLVEDGHMSERVFTRLKDIVNNYGMDYIAILFACFRVRYYASLSRPQWERFGYGWIKRTFETLVISHVILSPSILASISTIINCLKSVKTRFEMKENVLHYVDNVIHELKFGTPKSENVIHST